MILFGRKAHHVALIEVKSEKCTECGSKDLIISLFQRYFHFFLLPMFPLKKEAASQCLKCRDVKVEKKFSDNYKDLAKELKKKNSTPFWSFLGLTLLLLFVLLKKLLF